MHMTFEGSIESHAIKPQLGYHQQFHLILAEQYRSMECSTCDKDTVDDCADRICMHSMQQTVCNGQMLFQQVATFVMMHDST